MATIIGPNITLASVGPAGTPDIAYSNLFATGQTPWGVDNTWQICTSFADFLRLYGGLNKVSTIASGTSADTWTTETTDAVVQNYYAIKGFFDEKQSNSPGVLYFSRAIATSSGPTAGSKTYQDYSSTYTTTVAAKWKGAAGNTVQCTVINPSPRKGILTLQTGTVATTSGNATVTGTGTTFQTGSTWVGYGILIGSTYYTILSVASTTSLTLTDNASATTSGQTFYVGAGNQFAYFKFYFPQANITEEVDIGTAADAAAFNRISSLATITLPAGGQLPRSSAAAKINSGSAGTSDSYAATDSDHIGTTTAAGVKTGLQVFTDQKLGTGFVAIPGKYSSTIRSGLITHANTYFRHALFGTSGGLTLSTVVSDVGTSASNHASLYWPRVWVANQNSDTGGALLVDPVGHIAGLGARMDRDYRGPHKSPAGIDHPLTSVLDVERASNGNELVDDSGSDVLAISNINTIRAKKGITVYGLRTLATDERYRQINMSRTVELVYLSCFLILERYVMEPIDPQGRLFAKVKGDLDAFFLGLHRNGTIYGTPPGSDPKPDAAWFVVCSRGNNPPTKLGRGRLSADVSFVPTPNAEGIDLNILVAAPGFGSSAAATATI